MFREKWICTAPCGGFRIDENVAPANPHYIADTGVILVQCMIDGLEMRLGRTWDTEPLAEWLHSLGTVFRIYDDQDSGNLCFGVNGADGKLFVKFAGAPTARYDGDPADAVIRLKEAVPIYRHLVHPSLIRLLSDGETAGGYAAVFRWAEGICMGRQYPEDHRRFMALPAADKLRVYRAVLDFHRTVMARGWQNVDFYDGSVLYDPTTGVTGICDIDFYRPGPFTNTMGRMWGSSRFMAPEEFVRGERIAEDTCVFTMGKMAFALFADSAAERSAWPLSEKSWQVAVKATGNDRTMRYQTVSELITAWEASL